MLRALIFIFFGYLSGSVLYARFFCGIFRREELLDLSDDKNPGTTNAFRYCGFRCGTLTLIFDVLKGFVPVFFYMRYQTPDISSILTALVIASPVIGHVLPVFYHFKGGKGIATTFGCLAALYRVPDALLNLALFFILFSVVLEITPDYYRTISSYIFSLAADFIRIKNPAVVLGVLIITAVVLLRLLASGEKRTQMEVKLFGSSHTNLRNRRRP